MKKQPLERHNLGSIGLRLFKPHDLWNNLSLKLRRQ